MLARIHQNPVLPDDILFLMDVNKETLWFLRGGIPDYMEAHPDGEFVRHAVIDLLADADLSRKTLVHTDFWTDNLLWDGREIIAVLDWEEAGYGDPAIDVAYCRMDMWLNGMGRDAADRCLRVYEEAVGREVENLPLWELAATVRPMFTPSWLKDVRDELRAFIADVKLRLDG